MEEHLPHSQGIHRGIRPSPVSQCNLRRFLLLLLSLRWTPELYLLLSPDLSLSQLICRDCHLRCLATDVTSSPLHASLKSSLHASLKISLQASLKIPLHTSLKIPLHASLKFSLHVSLKISLQSSLK